MGHEGIKFRCFLAGFFLLAFYSVNAQQEPFSTYSVVLGDPDSFAKKEQHQLEFYADGTALYKRSDANNKSHCDSIIPAKFTQSGSDITLVFPDRANWNMKVMANNQFKLLTRADGFQFYQPLPFQIDRPREKPEKAKEKITAALPGVLTLHMIGPSRFLIYLIPAYIFLQLCWWAYLLIDLNSVHFLLLNDSGILTQEEAQKKLNGRIWMIVGEGLVFLVFLFIGLRFAHKKIMREVEEAKRQKNFMLAIAHEFKSPLASQKLQLETILKHQLDESKIKKMVANSLEDTERLQSLTENILTAYKLSEGDYPFFPEEFNLNEECAQIISRLPVMESQKEKVINLVADIPVKLDRQAFNSIVSNLIENAIKYGNGEPVEIRGEIQIDKVNISVSDGGHGIPAAYQEKVYERFFRLGGENTRKAPGTGLGLYIVKNLVTFQKGTISHRPNQPKGTIFEISIPQQR